MLSRRFRFHGYNSLRAVYGRGQTLRSNQLNLRYSQRPGNRPCRVAVVVSRKVSKSAVVRNRIRRRIYEAVRPNATQLTGVDLVFTVFNEQLADIEATNLQQQVAELLQKIPKSGPQTRSDTPGHAIVKTEREKG